MFNTITTTELIYLNEAAKALKQKSFQIYNNYIVGLDNIDSYIIYTTLDCNMFYKPSLSGAIINAKELSAFVKSITTESEFSLEDSNKDGIITLSTINDALIIDNRINMRFGKSVPNVIDTVSRIRMQDVLSPYRCVNAELEKIFACHKQDGCIYYIHDNKFFITLFAGLLPLNKADSIYLTIYEDTDNSFIAEFKISKKKFAVYVYIAYLNVPR